VFNIACNTRHSVLEIAHTIERCLGRTINIRHTPPRAGDVRHTQASIERAQRLLDYHPSVGFEEGMRRTVEALRLSLT
jgi:nucleoside-diphosphate-sugar epimerase